MKRILSVSVLAALATVALAQDAEKPEPEAPSAEEKAVKAAPKVSFSTLPLCRMVEGEAQVCLPGGEWRAAEEGKFYPLGTSYRTGLGGRMDVAFGPDAQVSLVPSSEVGTRAQKLGETSRGIVLVRGAVELKLPDNLPEGAFYVTAPGFVVKNPAGESRYVYTDMGDGDKVVVRCKTGALGVEGRHFGIPMMRAADEVVIRTSRDHLQTFLYGTSGDYAVRLDRGERIKSEVGDDGQMKETLEKGVEEWRLTPKTKVIITRAVPSVGERMSVFIMAFDAAGEPQGSGISFCEGRAEINSGELVAKEKLGGEELAKRAAEATETTAATDVEEAPATEAKAAESTSTEE